MYLYLYFRNFQPVTVVRPEHGCFLGRLSFQSSSGFGLVSGGEVGALHGVEAIDRVSYAGVQGACVCGGHEAVTQASQRRVAVDVMEN